MQPYRKADHGSAPAQFRSKPASEQHPDPVRNGKYLLTPRLCLSVYQSGVRRIGKFRDTLSTQMHQHIFRQVHPRSTIRHARQFVRHKLKECVQPEWLRATQHEQFFRRDMLPDFGLGSLCPRITVTIGVRTGLAVFVQTDIIHRPSIHSYRSNRPGRLLRAELQTLLKLGTDALEVPAQPSVPLYRSVAEAIDQINTRPALLPSQQRDTAALRAQINRNNGRKMVRHL